MEEILRLKRDVRFKDYVIDEFNINQFLVLESDMDNCASCKGLNECGNASKGYFHTVMPYGGDYTFPVKACKYRKDADSKAQSRSRIKTLYVSKSSYEASLADFSVDTESRKKALKYAQGFISSYSKNSFMKGMYIYGGYGSGKTYFASAISNALAEKGFSVLMVYFPDLARELKAMQFKDTLEDIINELKSVDILVIDDLGGENLNQFLRDDILGPVLNFRMEDKAPVFITSNLKPTDLFSHFAQTKEESYNNVNDDGKASRIMRRIECLASACDFKNSKYNGE